MARTTILIQNPRSPKLKWIGDGSLPEFSFLLPSVLWPRLVKTLLRLFVVFMNICPHILIYIRTLQFWDYTVHEVTFKWQKCLLLSSEISKIDLSHFSYCSCRKILNGFTYLSNSYGGGIGVMTIIWIKLRFIGNKENHSNRKNQSIQPLLWVDVFKAKCDLIKVKQN